MAAVGVGRGSQRRVVAHLQSGIPRSQCVPAPGDGRRAAGTYEDRAEQRVGLVAGGELGGEQRVAERQRAGVDGHDGGVAAGAVAEHDGDAVAHVCVRGICAVAPERVLARLRWILPRP